MTLSSHLQKSGFTHCIIGINHFETWANQVFDDKQKENVSKWLKNDCRLLFSKNGFAVFELIPTGATHSSRHQKGNVE